MDTIKLIAPITIGNNTYETITIRRPKVRDRLVVERMKKTDAEKEISMIANLAEVSVDVIEEMDLADYAKIQEVLQNFLEPSQATSD
jgi:CRISPR/Cas system CSM-associated protein Csm5 (group 7 of RAMP superfamily)